MRFYKNEHNTTEIKDSAVCTVDFSREETGQNTALQMLPARDEICVPDGKSSVRQTPGQKHFWIAGGAIAAIIVAHFVLQFSFIQSENVRLTENPVNIEKVEQTESFVKPVTQAASQPQAIGEIEDESETFVETAVKKEDTAKRRQEARKIQVMKRSPTVLPPAQSKPNKTTPTRAVNRKNDEEETRAERLRRVEKALTGV